MSFFIDTADIDLGDTPIENIFINDYMPMANGTYVKVYLLGYKYAYDRDVSIKLDNKTISRNLDIPLSDVLSAWDFWEEKGIVEKLAKEDGDPFDYKVRFLNLKQLYIDNNYKPVGINMSKKSQQDYSSSVKDVLEANENPEINKMFNQIDYIIRRPLVPNEKKTILDWLHNYNMNPDVVEKAFFQAMEKKGKRDIRYVAGIIKNWYDQGITNLQAYEDSLRLKNERYYSYTAILKSLGISGRNITPAEKKIVDKWFDTYKFNLDIILEAAARGTGISNPNINYMDSILTSWQESGYKSLDEIGKLDQKPKKENKGKTIYKKPSSKTKFHNFKQRTESYSEDDLERIAKKKREEYYKKTRGEG